MIVGRSGLVWRGRELGQKCVFRLVGSGVWLRGLGEGRYGGHTIALDLRRETKDLCVDFDEFKQYPELVIAQMLKEVKAISQYAFWSTMR